MFNLFTIKVIFCEYLRLGRKYDFPPAPIKRCHNPRCNKLVQFRKHGFYERYYISNIYDGKIVIRRYICPICGHTISIMPDFCLPKYLHGLEQIFEYTFEAYHRVGTLRACLEALNIKIGLNISRQLLYYYRKRFLENLTFIQHGIRQLDVEIGFADNEMTKIEKAKKVLCVVRNWPGPLNLFSQQFLSKNTKTIFAPNYNLL